MQFAKDFADLARFRADTLRKSNFLLTPVNMLTQNDWMILDGALSHKSGGFFHTVGLQGNKNNQQHLVLYQPQSALTGLLVYEENGELATVLQARVEPGNTDVVQYGPSIQSTAANYLKLHGGRNTDFLQYFNSFAPNSHLLSFTMQTDLGKRYFQKSKVHSYVYADGPVETTEITIGTKISTVSEAMSSDYFFNTDLRSLLAMFDWDYLATGERAQVTPNTELLTYYFNEKTKSSNTYKIIGLDNLKGWQVNESGIQSVSDNSLNLTMYKVSAVTRETPDWYQPLMECSGMGSVRLLRRVVAGQPEYLLSVIEEYGIDNTTIIGPTSILYPEEASNEFHNIPDGEVFRCFKHSEEGGRFRNHESLFEVINVDQNIPTLPNQFWVNAGQLKQLFMSSNMIAIQLRVIASVILDELNPVTLS